MSMTQHKRIPEDVNIFQSGVAGDFSVSPTAVQQVINHTTVSHRIRFHIAEVINKQVDAIWDIKDPARIGQPLTMGIYDR